MSGILGEFAYINWSMLIKIVKEIRDHKFIYLLLFLILIGATFVRVYNTRNILGFYYDQGRDALVIWNFLHKGDIFLVGPTTGLQGVLLGPLFYLIITPFYFLGGGNPVWPANFLAILTVISIIVVYVFSLEFFNRYAGLITAGIVGFSYYLIVAARWLANPTPIFLTSAILLYSLAKIVKKKESAWWVVAVLMIGFSLQFEAASAVFYLPAFAIFIAWQRKKLPSRRILVASVFVFILTLAPQIIFEIKNNFVITRAILRTLFEEKSFRLSFWEVLAARLSFYWKMFFIKIWIANIRQFWAFSLGVLAIVILNFRELWANKTFRILILFGASPLIGFILFQGNEGNVFDYYFSGFYLIYILLFAIGLSYLVKSKFGMIFLVLFFVLFFQMQIPAVKKYLVVGRSNVSLKEQLAAIDWVYKDADGRAFNVDVYVPPIIPYAYDYLFKWQALAYGYEPSGDREDLLYTLYEKDGGSKFFREWISRQEGIGKLEEETVFRGLVVQRRNRI